MKKRLLAVLLACCMAAGMANAVFAADELPRRSLRRRLRPPTRTHLPRNPKVRRSRPRRLTPRQRPRPHAPS